MWFPGEIRLKKRPPLPLSIKRSRFSGIAIDASHCRNQFAAVGTPYGRSETQTVAPSLMTMSSGSPVAAMNSETRAHCDRAKVLADSAETRLARDLL